MIPNKSRKLGMSKIGSTANSIYQRFRRYYYAFKRPAVWLPVSLGREISGGQFYVLSSLKLFAAPSRKQAMALQRTLSQRERDLELYCEIFRILEVTEDDVIVDIGANIGYSTLAFQKAFSIVIQGRTGKQLLKNSWVDVFKTSPKFILVEPNPRNFRFIDFNLRMISSKKWLLLPFGLGGKTGVRVAGIDSGYALRGRKVFTNSGLLSFSGKNNFKPGTQINLPVIDGKTFLEILKEKPIRVRFCKIDTEGMELEILEILNTWFAAGRTVFQIEVNPLYADQSFKQGVLNLCNKYNYCILVEGDSYLTGSMEWYLVPISLRDIFLRKTLFIEHNRIY